MRAAPFWQVLGIEPTADAAAVRAAYAAKLKVTNPEDDAEGFKKLRAAYEAALRDSRWRAHEAANPATDDDIEEEFYDDYGDYDDIGLPPPRAPRSPVAPRGRADVAPEPVDPEQEAHRQTCMHLESLLFANGDREEIGRAYTKVRASPAMTALDTYTNTEYWLINLIHRARPASEVLIERAIADFGWEKAAGRVRDGGGAASILHLRKYIAQEREATEMLARMQDPRHEFNSAYKEIMRPFAGRSWLSRSLALMRAGLMQRFLDYIAAKNPVAEDQFDQDALHWWRQKLSRSKSPLWFWHVLARGGVAVLLIAGLIAFIPPSEPSSERGSGASQDPRGTARAHCVVEQAMLQIRSTSRGDCERMLELAPDSLLMRQYAGVVALHDRNPSLATQHFDAILAAAPLDSYALYGAGVARALSEDAAQRTIGFEMIDQALAANPGVRMYFDHLGVPIPLAPMEADRPPVAPRELPRRRSPPYDTAPHTIGTIPSEAIEAALQHFGMRDLPEGRATLQCLVGADGRLSACLIVDESPANLGVGEVALHTAGSVMLSPATLDGAPVDGVPIRIPFVFRSSASETPPPEETPPPHPG